VKAFSIEKALGAGFGLIRREPLAVVMWGLAYAVMTVVIQAIGMGPALGAVITALLTDPDDAAVAFEKAAQANSLVMAPLILVLSLGASAILYGAIARAVLHPDDRRAFFMRLSKRELWIAVSYLALTVLFVVAAVVICIPVAVAIRLLSDGSMGSIWAWGFLLGLPALVAILYLSARFSMTWIMAWRLTKGHGWRLLLLTLALVFLIVIATLGVVLAVVVVGGILAGIIKAMGVVGAILGIVAVCLLIVLYVALFGAMYAVLLAPYIEAYRGIRDAPAGAEPEPAAS
jgi:hypothetical protein